MTRSLSLAALLPLLACSRAAAPAPVPAPVATLSLAEGLRIADEHRVAAITTRRTTHAEFWAAVAPSLTSPRLTVEEVGRSTQGRELRTITFGNGPVTVLLWSQMHGDEPTATMALADIFAWMAAPGTDPLRDRLARELTIVMLPMLNPDGAQRYQRQNVGGIDINRDARNLSTPEGRTLKAVRDRLQPQFGFNLHDQSARTRAGRNGVQAAIALLAPAADAERSWGPVRSRARQVAAGIARTLAPELPGRIAQYDDTFNPRAFGDLMQTWGTSTVLIESGALPNDPEKQQLRRLHVPAILGALDAIATGAYTAADIRDYESLPFNAGGAVDLLVRGGQIAIPGSPPFRADIAINFDDAVARTGGRISEVGDLSAVVAIDTIDATGRVLHPQTEALARDGVNFWLPIGHPAVFEIKDGTGRVVGRLR
jgi:hypothetical protein